MSYSQKHTLDIIKKSQEFFYFIHHIFRTCIKRYPLVDIFRGHAPRIRFPPSVASSSGLLGNKRNRITFVQQTLSFPVGWLLVSG